MVGRTPGNITTIRPMKDGVIADFKLTQHMLNFFFRKADGRKTMVQPRFCHIAVPSESTQVEKRAVSILVCRAKRVRCTLWNKL